MTEPSMDWGRVQAVTRNDLKALVQARDFWIPTLVMSTVFFLVIPLSLLLSITSMGDVDAIQQMAKTLTALPEGATAQIANLSPEAQTGYALAVFLIAPIVVIVPLTVSTAVGASIIVGERERGTGEFLAHSPADSREIYLGKLIASYIPGYLTVLVGFAIYTLVVNLVVGPLVGYWFFPTTQWWVMLIWVLPPFLGLCLSLVLRISARVNTTAAAQQASGLVSLPLIMVAYSQATGVLFGAGNLGPVIGAAAWLVAWFSIRRGIVSVKRARLLST